MPVTARHFLRLRHPAVAVLAIAALIGSEHLSSAPENGSTAAYPPHDTNRGGGPAVALPPPLVSAPEPQVSHADFVAGSASEGIPETVLSAYRRASDSLNVSVPECHLRWEVLAGIGKVESDHANNGDVTADGEVLHPIFGPPLDGANGTAALPRTTTASAGYSGLWERAEGPMQFLPSTWAKWGSDATGDGRKSIQNVYDASLAAGHYLCAASTDLASGASLRDAILRYNPSEDYLNTVTYWILVYQGGAAALPDEPSTSELPGETYPAASTSAAGRAERGGRADGHDAGSEPPATAPSAGGQVPGAAPDPAQPSVTAPLAPLRKRVNGVVESVRKLASR